MKRPHTDWDIVEVLRRFGLEGEVRGGSGWVEIRCPFHDDRNKSAGVHAGRNIFRCHACDAKGNPVTLVKQQRGGSWAEAIEWLDAGLGSSRAMPKMKPTGEWWRAL